MNKPSVGGQALIEGVLMRSGSRIAMSFRTPTGEILTEIMNTEKAPTGAFALPILRGLYSLYQSFRMGTKALNRSAEVSGIESEPDALERFLQKHFKKHADTVMMVSTILMSLVLALLLFSAAPTFLAGLFRTFIPNGFILSLLEGLIKVMMFLIYLLLISQMKEIKRVFQYHGAEHKAVFTYEAGLPLTVENARMMSRLHPRCGTSYIFFVLGLSILFFSLVSWASVTERIILKILFFPFLAGISYEVLKYTARDNAVVRVLRFPGLMLQKITTREPDDSQLEVALTALKGAIDDDTSSHSTV